MPNFLETQLKGWRHRDFIAVGITILTLIAVIPMLQQNKLFFFDLSPQLWILLPLIPPIVNWVILGRIAPEQPKGIILEDPGFLMWEYYNSPTKQFLGEPCDTVYVLDWLPNPKTGDMIFRIKENGRVKLLIMDGRKNPIGSRGYGLISEDLLPMYGFKTYTDIFRKVGRASADTPITQMLAQLEPEQMMQVLAERPEYAPKGEAMP